MHPSFVKSSAVLALLFVASSLAIPVDTSLSEAREIPAARGVAAPDWKREPGSPDWRRSPGSPDWKRTPGSPDWKREPGSPDWRRGASQADW
ncbi:hypothetical protein ONZ45_g5737 [Pleurotus djamor]|nr:hypothetical protein ONZ45_g5737 [Pleurotus djamor]